MADLVAHVVATHSQILELLQNSLDDEPLEPEQVPHLIEPGPGQPSLMRPQFFLSKEHVVATHSHTCAALHTSWFPVHVPQCSVPPQPSLMLPHTACCAAHVVGVHRQVKVIPSQCWFAGHVPQCKLPPQPSFHVPHARPPHVSGMHRHVFATQASFAAQVPQSSKVPHPGDKLLINVPQL